jgi:hemerythrin-like domain-containing protein
MESTKATNAIKLLKADHKKVKQLFKEFEGARDSRQKQKIAQEALQELKIHSLLEDEIFYPAVKKPVEREEPDIMMEAEEEHHVANLLIAELERLTGKDENFEAKFTVLMENVQHHIKEEEGTMLPAAAESSVDMEALGAQMLQRKEQLLSEGLPTTPEAELVGSAR